MRLESVPSSAIVDGDERRLRELLRNLGDNALRHARSTVRIASRQDASGCALIVEDDGEGIAESERDRIFERFYRNSGDGQGTGLGLAIVRWIAQAHGGTVVAGEASLGGAKFVATIPPHRSD